MHSKLENKITKAFGSLSVKKADSQRVGFGLMPRFVTEFLIARAREKNAALSMDDVREKIRRFSVEADRKGSFIAELMRTREARLIALLEVEPRPETNAFVGRIAVLDGNPLAVSPRLCEQYPELLDGGLWGTCLLRFELKPTPHIVVDEFTPYQLTNPDMTVFREARKDFSLDEWIDLLLTSAGYRPEGFADQRLKLLALTRLVPLAQSNVNIVELGPRGTGKSYLLRSLSPRAYLIAGARATAANLLYDLSRRQVGIIGRKKVVVLDEIGATQFSDLSLVAMLKDFMESGQIARGGKALQSDCSLVFSGNVSLDADGVLPAESYLHLFEVFPRPLTDSAIADRIHGLIPGWELPKISDDVLADGVGLLSDYFGEVLGELRHDVEVEERVERELRLMNATKRDSTAVRRISAGLLKMLYPHGSSEQSGLELAVKTAIELRQRVHNQLTVMEPGEFPRKSIAFEGMTPHNAPDFAGRSAVNLMDVNANQRDLTGTLTILLVSARGGGDVGFIECALNEGSGVSLSGLRGATLEQSVRAAHNALLHLGDELGIETGLLARRKMAVHLVNIAEPKDGPSAGLAFALAMLSAATGRKIRKGLAVTGEVSIHGIVSAVGGIREKLQAAHRHGRTTVIIPAENKTEAQRAGEAAAALSLRPVRTLAEAVAIALEPSER